MSWIRAPVEAYKRWIWLNKDYVQSIDSLANGLTWLLPERFSESEIGPEAVTALLGIISSLNQHIIESTTTLQNQATSQIKSFPYSLYISAVKELETLVEVAAQHYLGNEKKWTFLALIEAIKVALRLALLHKSGYRMLLNGEESSSSEEEKRPIIKGNALKAFNQFGESARMAIDETMLRRIQHQQAILQRPEKRTLSKLISEKGVNGVFFVAGEILYIFRPLIYVLLIRKFGPRKWTPWLVSLVIDLIGVGFLTTSTTKLLGKNPGFVLSESERNELRRRKLIWVLYLMRDPFFSIYTRPKLESGEKTLEPVPGVGILVGKIVELVIGAQSRYTYISGS